MNFQELNARLTELHTALNLFEPGDLMTMMDIKERFRSLQTDFEKNDALKDIGKFCGLLSTITMMLSEIGFEQQTKDILQKSDDVLIRLFSKQIKGQEAAEQISGLIRLAQELIKTKEENIPPKAQAVAETTKQPESPTGTKASEGVHIANEYTEGYFSNIVDDQKMLSQLCDEMKEHLDNAQFTLVDLEHDSENQEKINKTFRSFHTIKGSSAFLGLKNVEDTSHVMEDLLVLIRDGKMKISRDIIDVVFYGLELLRNLAAVMLDTDFNIEAMKEHYLKIDIFRYIRFIRDILNNYETRDIRDIIDENTDISRTEIRDALERLSGSGEASGSADDEESGKSAFITQSVSGKKSAYVKVSNERLNLLIDIVGELVINQSMLRQTIADSMNIEKKDIKDDRKTNADKIISQLEGITTNIKNLVLAMGMVPIAEIFNKLRVVIRNTSNDLKKVVNAEIWGEETELDRNVVEAIYDPLVHIVRNAIDHGLESADKREKAGKPKVGRLQVYAEHKGNGIQIIVEDDGKGIDKEAVLKKAIANGLIAEEAAESMSEKEVYALLFQPGFSTAEKVTEVSGRGVGLDVVKKNIEEIRGKTEVVSELGKFTRFVIKLPLTLAIIEGFVVEIGANKYVLPFNVIEEILVPEQQQINTMDNGSRLLFNRGSYIPMIESAAVLNEHSVRTDESRMLAVVLAYEGKFYGLLVDRIVGKQEIVIKNLGESLSHMSVFSGGTIFGDGTIGFVVDIEGFLDTARKKENKV